jgi:hypothetical protein
MKNEMKKQIYLCKPSKFPVDELDAIVQVLEQNGNTVVQFLKYPYDVALLTSSDYIVAVLNKPVDERFLINKGQDSEFKVAYAKELPIYVYYNKQFYPVKDIINIPNDGKRFDVPYSQIILGNSCYPPFINPQEEK